MSALNVLKFKSRVILATDAAVWNSAGIVQGFAAKVFPVPGWPGVVASRGLPLATPILGHLLAVAFPSWDALVDGVEAALPSIHRQAELLCRKNLDAAIVLAGWSAERGPEAFLIRTAEDCAGTTLDEPTEVMSPPIFKLYPLKTMLRSPYVTPEALKKSEIYGMPSEDMSEGALNRYLIRLLNLQRRNFYCPPGSEPFSGTGGHILVTSISADAVVQKVIHRWPQDVIGEKITIVPQPVSYPAVAMGAV